MARVRDGRTGSALRVLATGLTIGGALVATVIAALAAFVPTSSTAAQPTTGCRPSSSPLAIAIVGDSYSTGLDQALETVLCRSRLITDPRITMFDTGGASLDTHYSDGESSELGGNAIVVLQDQSEIPGFPTDQPLYQASLRALDEFGSAATAAGARVVLFQTWGHQTGDAYNAQFYPTYPVMQDRIVQGYAQYLAELRSGPAPTAQVAAVGQAWQWVQQHSAALFASLYASDGSHPSVKGTYLAALVFAQQISGAVLPSRVWVPPGVSSHDAALLAQAARSVWPRAGTTPPDDSPRPS